MDKESIMKEIEALEIKYKQTRDVVEKPSISGKIAALKRELSKIKVEKKNPVKIKDVPVVADHVDSNYDGSDRISAIKSRNYIMKI